MIDGLAGQGFANVIDLGTGTGLLAFAARHLWPAAQVMATDIDPIAIEVTEENMATNHVAAIELVVADGARSPAIAEHAPYDLLIANILAGPLVAMAPEVAAIAGPHATIVLAGLLTNQAETVIDAYRAGLRTRRARRAGGLDDPAPHRPGNAATGGNRRRPRRVGDRRAVRLPRHPGSRPGRRGKLSPPPWRAHIPACRA